MKGMNDREKVIKTLESILDADIYEDWLSGEDRQNVCDVINLLKEQEEEIKKTRETIEECHKIADRILAKRS